MSTANFQIGPPGRDSAIAALPKPFRDAPPDVQRSWFRGRAQQYSMLRTVAVGFGLIFIAVMLLRAASITTSGGTDIVVSLLAVGISVWMSVALTRARRRSIAFAELFNDEEQQQ